MNKKEKALQSWKSLAEPIKFTPEDFEILDLTLHLIPDLRICAFLLKEAQTKGVHYPIKSVDELLNHLEKGQLVAGHHIIDADEIRTYMPKEYFPIEHEGELLSKVFTALGRQRNEMSTLSTINLETIERYVANHKSQEAK